MHLGRVSGVLGHEVAAVPDPHRMQEVFVQMVGELRRPVGERSAHAHVVDDRDVLDVLAQADAAGVRTHRHAELRRHQQHGEHLVEATDPTRVDLAVVDRLACRSCLKMTRFAQCSPVATPMGATAARIAA